MRRTFGLLFSTSAKSKTPLYKRNSHDGIHKRSSRVFLSKECYLISTLFLLLFYARLSLRLKDCLSLTSKEMNPCHAQMVFFHTILLIVFRKKSEINGPSNNTFFRNFSSSLLLFRKTGSSPYFFLERLCFNKNQSTCYQVQLYLTLYCSTIRLFFQ